MTDRLPWERFSTIGEVENASDRSHLNDIFGEFNRIDFKTAVDDPLLAIPARNR